ncbi:MAG: XRE family transcriptional regulator [Verrucomicrobiae bacterium]|nr:XRE family transcriptional regulator [Verrucomicrobiae bacterium]
MASARTLRGYKPIQVAELLGVNPNRYHNWEADVCKVEDKFAQQLSSLLHVLVDYLTGDSL